MTTPSSTRQEVTQLLGDWSRGDEGALEKLFPLVQPELHRLAYSPSGGSLMHVINLDESDARAAVLSSQDGREGARRQTDEDA